MSLLVLYLLTRSEHRASTKPSSESGAITCNSTRMVREKISPRDNGTAVFVSMMMLCIRRIHDDAVH